MEMLPVHCEAVIIILKEKEFVTPSVFPEGAILNSYLSIDDVPRDVYEGFNALVIDVYNLNERNLKEIRSWLNIPIVIFGYSGKKYKNTLVVNVAEGRGPFPTYVEKDILEGSAYFVSNPILESIRNSYARENELDKILCVFGGTDPANLSAKVISHIKELDLNYDFTIVSNNILLEEKKIPGNVKIIGRQDNLPATFCSYDLVITSPGNIYFEAMIVGIPVIAITQSVKQESDFKGYPWIYKPNEMRDCLSSLKEIHKRSKSSKDGINPGSGMPQIVNYININCQ
ncbi:hypothetical protein CPT03_16770 [Pedobacter ginsengisoli]|uniref:Glycosyl transferase family 28 C-terminal domain-containing protein n=2 Tax=Pedobacter ginsengisoli TaxID=363852 RepID=A0A2D1U8U1_9SPHI|nr:hypothetical protein CPT03_16770 [Pedobacter ginsengisoli]